MFGLIGMQIKYLIYKDEMVFCSFLFVCMELIQIHISEMISTELCISPPFVWRRS